MEYNLASTPWAGGLFEHMIQTVKTALRKTLKNARLTQEELHTTIIEIEATVNSRPLCYAYSEEVDNVLTPTHLIIGKCILNIPDPDSPENTEIIYESDNAICNNETYEISCYDATSILDSMEASLFDRASRVSPFESKKGRYIFCYRKWHCYCT